MLCYVPSSALSFRLWGCHDKRPEESQGHRSSPNTVTLLYQYQKVHSDFSECAKIEHISVSKSNMLRFVFLKHIPVSTQIFTNEMIHLGLTSK